MRVRTEAMRESILDSATRVFVELGYERATMSDIAARLGGSKATLYGYFENKEQLFREVVRFKLSIPELLLFLHEAQSRAYEDPRALLTRVGEHFMLAISTPDAIALRRTIMAHALHLGMGEEYWRRTGEQIRDLLSAYLAAATDAGQLDIKAPMIAAEQVLALYEAETNWQWRCGNEVMFPRQRIRQAVARAVDLFLKAYGPSDKAAARSSKTIRSKRVVRRKLRIG